MKLGMLNSRMKNFFDLWCLSQDFSFDGKTLAQAVKKTLRTRQTAVPNEPPSAFTAEFYDAREKNAQWKAFLIKSGLSTGAKSLPEIAAILTNFLMPVSPNISLDEHWSSTILCDGVRVHPLLNYTKGRHQFGVIFERGRHLGASYSISF